MLKLEENLIKLLEKSEYILETSLDNKKEEILSARDKMEEFMKEHKEIAAGLSAVQVGINLPMFMISEDDIIRTFLNPKFTPVFNKTHSPKIDSLESCLSFPGISCVVSRYKKIYIYGYEIKNDEFIKSKSSVVLKDSLSVVFQHEYDHLQGITILQKGEKLGNFSLNKDQYKIYAIEEVDDYIVDGETETIFRKINHNLKKEDHYVIGIKTKIQEQTKDTEVNNE